MSGLWHYGQRLLPTLLQEHAGVNERRRSTRPTAQPSSVAADKRHMTWRSIGEVIAAVLLQKLPDS